MKVRVENECLFFEEDRINMEDEVRVLKAYTDMYNSGNAAKEEVYRNYYDEEWQQKMKEGTLEKFFKKEVE